MAEPRQPSALALARSLSHRPASLLLAFVLITIFPRDTSDLAHRLMAPSGQGQHLWFPSGPHTVYWIFNNLPQVDLSYLYFHFRIVLLTFLIGCLWSIQSGYQEGTCHEKVEVHILRCATAHVTLGGQIKLHWTSVQNEEAVIGVLRSLSTLSVILRPLLWKAASQCNHFCCSVVLLSIIIILWIYIVPYCFQKLHLHRLIRKHHVNRVKVIIMIIPTLHINKLKHR